MLPCEKSKMVSITSSRMIIIVVFPTQSRFPGKLICSIVFGSGASYLLKSTAIK